MTAAKPAHFHTTIKVTSDVRDRLKRQAEAGDRTLGAQIAYLIELGDRQSRMDALQTAVAAAPPDQAYFEEIEFWDAVSSG